MIADVNINREVECIKRLDMEILIAESKGYNCTLLKYARRHLKNGSTISEVIDEIDSNSDVGMTGENYEAEQALTRNTEYVLNILYSFSG
jgi:hypothetical protein